MDIKDKFFANIYAIIYGLTIVAAYLTVAILLIAGILFLIEKTSPEEVHIFNNNLTIGLVDELIESNHHRAAIFLMEENSDFLKEPSSRKRYIKNLCKLTDCYIHVGAYDKAKESLLKAESNPFNGKFSIKDTDGVLAFYYCYSISSRLAQIYTITGDCNSAQRYTVQMFKSAEYLLQHSDELTRTLGEKFNENELRISILTKEIDIAKEQNLTEFLDIAYKALHDKNGTPAFKLHILNKSAEVLLEYGDTLSIARYVFEAVQLAQTRQFMSDGDYSELGVLSDYCYFLHDKEHWRYFLHEYMGYLNEKYNKNDLEYLVNCPRTFRLLEEDRDYAKLESSIESCCVGLRDNIEKNFRCMSEEERDYLAKFLDGPFDYAIEYLYRHPESKRIAKVCFDNIMFEQGLKLRSSMAVENAVKALNDVELNKKYDSLVRCKQELDVRQCIRGLGNAREISKLEEKVARLDKFVSEKCWAYRYNNFEKQNTHEDLLSVINNDEVVIEFSQTTNGRLYCLILNKTGSVSFVHIADFSDIAGYLKQSPDIAYRNTDFTDKVFNGIRSHVRNAHKIYYSTSGVFNSICIPALRERDSHYLCDSYEFKLVSNCQKIIELKAGNISGHRSMKNEFCLWGGIEYAINETEVTTNNSYRSIGRHQALAYLGSDEIDAISSILDNANTIYAKFPGCLATEKSFKDQSKKGIEYLHVSTHGFFDNSTNSREAMHNSVLFFAGSNRYWTNDTLQIPNDGNEGILRADEISHLNLSGCKLVVLSACETGLGYTGSNEGVYGLQRAFKLAGANKIMMSLWNVKNQKTNELMRFFYEKLCSNGYDIEDAFQYGRREMKSKYPNNPEYWAAFVLLD